MGESIVVTVDLEPQRADQATDVVELRTDMTWSDFELVLKVAFSVDECTVKYMDEDEDLVTISSDDELKEAFKVACKQNNMLRVRLCQSRPSPAPRASTVQSQPGPVTMDREATPPVAMDATPTPMITKEATSDSSSSDDSMLMEEEDESPKDTSPDSPGRWFHIRHVTSDLVLDVEAWNKTPGTRVILFGRKRTSNQNQLFTMDTATGTIKSLFCGLYLEADQSGLKVQTYSDGKASQQWRLEESRLVSVQNTLLVLGVGDSEVKEGAWPRAEPRSEHVNQHWAIVHVMPHAIEGIFMMPPPIHHNAYSELAHQMSLHVHSTGGATSSNHGGAPQWFIDYMKQFKHDLSEEISEVVARKTVRRIMNSLVEGQLTLPLPPTSSEAMALEDSDPRQRLVHHFGVVCDECEQHINGVRYKCGNCDDYDLCSRCEARVTEAGSHDTDHVFIKIRRPAMAFPRRKSGTPAPLLKRSLYPTNDEIQKIQEKMLRKQEKLRRRGEKAEERMKRRDDKLKRRHEHYKEIPSKKERLEFPLPTPHFSKFDAHFMRDDNYPDGSVVAPDVQITKRWVMANTGTEAWDEHTKLRLMWGNIPAVDDAVKAPLLKPHEEGIMAVTFITPAHPGVYQSHWRMSHESYRFGHRVWCSIVVKLPENNDKKAHRDEYINMLSNVKALADSEKSCEDVEKSNVTAEKSDLVAEKLNMSHDNDDGEKVENKEEAYIVEEPAEVEIQREEVTVMEQRVEVIELDAEAEGEKTAVKEERKGSKEGDILSENDILSFEMLDIRDRSTPKVSQTATPTNTPMAMTPPKSPVHELEEHPLRQLSTSSSVELVSESSDETSASHMTELVQERIAKLGLKPDLPDDIETISTCSENSDSESDFYIVPLPDCFNPNLPLSTSTSTSVIMSKEEVKKTVDDFLTASRNLSEPTLEPEVIDLTQEMSDEEEEGESLVHVDQAEATIEAVNEESVKMETAAVTQHAPAQEVETATIDENANSLPTTPDAATCSVTLIPPVGASFNKDKGDEAVEEQTEEVIEKTTEETSNSSLTEVKKVLEEEGAEGEEKNEGKGENEEEKQNESELKNEGEKEREGEKTDEAVGGRPEGLDIPVTTRGSKESSVCSPHTPPSPSVLASTLMTAAIGVATQAAATAYTTAKDVFHTLQANKEYVPPKSKWTPPKQDFTLPESTWSPSTQEWTPPQPDSTPATPRTEMDQLVEMGFADRELNKQLLKQYKNDVQKVVQELITRQDAEWHQNRH